MERQLPPQIPLLSAAQIQQFKTDVRCRFGGTVPAKTGQVGVKTGQVCAKTGQ